MVLTLIKPVPAPGLDKIPVILILACTKAGHRS